MNISQMRKIDTFMGGLICLVLELNERLVRTFSRNNKPFGPPKRILVTKYLGMGSILLATPMLRKLKSTFPESRITFLTFESNVSFTKQIPLIDETLSLRTSSFISFTKDLLNVLYRIRKERFDVVFDLEFFPRFSTIVSYLSGAPVRTGYYLPKLWRGNLLTHHIHFNPHRHVTEVLAAQLEPYGHKVTDFSLTPLVVNQEKSRRVGMLLREKGLKDGKSLITVNVNASDLSTERRWPKEGFVELITEIVKSREEVWIALVGSKGEAEYVRTVYEAIPEEARGRVMNLSGGLDIEEFTALLKTSKLLISNDSGPLHIASSLGTATVSFFGPESPSFYGPAGSNNTVFYAGIYCSPCLNVYNAKTAMCKGDNKCMKEIKASEVIDALRKKGIL